MLQNSDSSTAATLAPTLTAAAPSDAAAAPTLRRERRMQHFMGTALLVVLMLTVSDAHAMFGGVTGFMGEVKAGLSGPVAKGVAGLMLASGAVALIAGNKQAFTTILWAAAGVGGVGIIVGLAG